MRQIRPPSRLALLRQATTYRPTSALSNHEGLHGMPTPITDDSRSPSVVSPDVYASTSRGSPDSSSFPHIQRTAPHSAVRMPQPRRPLPGRACYPRDPTRLIIPGPEPPKLSTIIIPIQPDHRDPEESPDPPSSATTPKRGRWSYSDDEEEDGQEFVFPSVVQRFHQDQIARDIRSPSPPKRQRKDQGGSVPSSPIALSSRVVETGASTH